MLRALPQRHKKPFPPSVETIYLPLVLYRFAGSQTLRSGIISSTLVQYWLPPKLALMHCVALNGDLKLLEIQKKKG